MLSITYYHSLYALMLSHVWIKLSNNYIQMNNPYNIYYDMQRNSFYRINKDTGDSIKSYLNGQNLPTFKPNITGFQYQNRKGIVDHNYFSRKQAPKSSLVKQYSPKTKLLVKLKMNSIHTDSTHTNWEQKQKYYNSLSNSRVTTHLFQPNSTKYLHQLSTIEKPKERESFEEKAKYYEKKLQKMKQQNHSPLKDKEGSAQRPQILDRLCITKSVFNKSLHLEKQITKSKIEKKKLKGSKDVAKLLEQYSIQKQIKQQRKLKHFQMHTISFEKSAKSTEKDRDRNINLKKLQKLMIRNNQNNQRKPFGID